MSPPDFIKNEYAIVLPLLNYEVHFDSFLVVGPIIITGLTIYLHIFVGEYRRYKASPDVNYTMLHDFESWAPRLAVVAIFYWMVPVTLAAFTWNTTTTGRGYIEWFPILLTSAVTAGLIVLQIRRCPKKLRPRAYPWLFLVSAGFMGVLISIVSPPTSNEPQASPATDDGNEQARARTDFEEKDYSGEIFSSGHEGFKGANLPGVNFRRAKLIEADLSDANLSGANFRYADLTGASLVAAELSGADFFGAILHGVDISDVDLWGVKIDSYQLRQVCGENVESVPGNFFIKPCEP